MSKLVNCLDVDEATRRENCVRCRLFCAFCSNYFKWCTFECIPRIAYNTSTNGWLVIVASVQYTIWCLCVCAVCAMWVCGREGWEWISNFQLKPTHMSIVNENRQKYEMAEPCSLTRTHTHTPNRIRNDGTYHLNWIDRYIYLGYVCAIYQAKRARCKPAKLQYILDICESAWLVRLRLYGHKL